MITRTIKTTAVEYTIFNRETDEVNNFTIALIGTYPDEKSIVKALQGHILDHEIVLKTKTISVTTDKYGMSLNQFVATAVKLED